MKLKRRIRRGFRKFKRYMRETLFNKLLATFLIMVGVLSNYILDDGTFLVFAIMFGGYLFFTPEDCMYHVEEES